MKLAGEDGEVDWVELKEILDYAMRAGTHNFLLPKIISVLLVPLMLKQLASCDYKNSFNTGIHFFKEDIIITLNFTTLQFKYFWYLCKKFLLIFLVLLPFYFNMKLAIIFHLHFQSNSLHPSSTLINFLNFIAM